MTPQRQHYLSPKPFDAVAYGIYIEAQLAGDHQLEDTNRFENEGGQHTHEEPLPPHGARSQDQGELATLRRNARTTDRDELTALAEAHGWTRSTATTYDKAGWPRLDIPTMLEEGDALAVINAVQAENAAGGE